MPLRPYAAALASSKGRLILCTVPGSTPNCLAICRAAETRFVIGRRRRGTPIVNVFPRQRPLRIAGVVNANSLWFRRLKRLVLMAGLSCPLNRSLGSRWRRRHTVHRPDHAASDSAMAEAPATNEADYKRLSANLIYASQTH